MSLENIHFFVGDNCATNKRCANLAGKPLVGCHAHRLHLAAKSVMETIEHHLVKLDALVSKMKTMNNHAKLKTKTALAPIPRQETRWTSTQEMIQRYFKLKPFIEELAAGDADLTALLLSPTENFAVKSCFDTVLVSLRECSKYLQRRKQPLNLAEARACFDVLIDTHGMLKDTQIDAKHSIVHSPHFENGVVKILNNEEEKMTHAEKNACKMFLIEPKPAAPATAAAAAADGRVDFQAALKKRKMDAEKKGSNYINLSFIPTGSVEVESLLSTAKYIATDYRARLLPVTLEMLMFLKHNRRFWDVSHVHEALQLPDSELFDDDDGDDE